MRRPKLQIRDTGGRWPKIFTLCLLLILPSCSESQNSSEADSVEIFAKAIEENKEFDRKIRSKEKAAIDLSYLDDKFPGLDICYHHGYSVSEKITNKYVNKELININMGESRVGKESRYVYFIDKNSYFIYHLNDDYIANLAGIINIGINKNPGGDYQCIKARDVDISLDDEY